MSRRVIDALAAKKRRRLVVPRPPAPPAVVPIRRLWPNSVVVCLGSGPSLTRDDVDYCCGKARVIAISDTYKWAPWADALYSCDSKWWHWHKGVPSFTGQKYSLDVRVRKSFPDITIVRDTGEKGLETDPTGVRTGKNSGYQAINLAVHLGARKIILLGYDMRFGAGGKTHFFGDHPDRRPPPVKFFLPKFESLVAPLSALGIEVIDCTRESALTVFPQQSLADALREERLESIA